MALETAPPLAISGFFTIGLGLIVLVMGYQRAKSKQYKNHRRLMILAVIVLALFLIQYIIRAVVLHQETRFEGDPFVRNFIYIPVLAIHITGAIITIILISIHLTKSLRNEQFTENQVYFPKSYRNSHRRTGRITFYLWLFSYLGGITVFVLLYII